MQTRTESKPEMPGNGRNDPTLVERVRTLERELDAALAELETTFVAELREAGEDARTWIHETHPQNLLSLPFIYGMAIPLAFLDLCISLYQHICFRLYGVARVPRREYFVLDRHRLPYLNAVQKAHCVYCGYANGLLAYAREIAARTEQYWCPIEHSHHARGTHTRARHFVAYGDEHGFLARQSGLRDALAPEGTSPVTDPHTSHARSDT